MIMSCSRDSRPVPMTFPTNALSTDLREDWVRQNWNVKILKYDCTLLILITFQSVVFQFLLMYGIFPLLNVFTTNSKHLARHLTSEPTSCQLSYRRIMFGIVTKIYINALSLQIGRTQSFGIVSEVQLWVWIQVRTNFPKTIYTKLKFEENINYRKSTEYILKIQQVSNKTSLSSIRIFGSLVHAV